jgi:hypothetical protein
MVRSVASMQRSGIEGNRNSPDKCFEYAALHRGDTQRR